MNNCSYWRHLWVLLQKISAQYETSCLLEQKQTWMHPAKRCKGNKVEEVWLLVAVQHQVNYEIVKWTLGDLCKLAIYYKKKKQKAAILQFRQGKRRSGKIMFLFLSFKTAELRLSSQR